jgi:PAS domain S-box-containing protein
MSEGETRNIHFSVVNSGENAVSSCWKLHLGKDGLYYVFHLPDHTASPQTTPRKATAVSENEPEVSMLSLRCLIDQSPDMMARFDHKLRYTFVNQEFINQTANFSKHQFYGKTTAEMAPLLGLPADNFDHWMQDLQRVLNIGQEVMHYDSVKLPTHTLHFQTKMFPEYLAGEIKGVLVITRILNELKYSEEKLKEQKNLLKQVFDCMQEGVMVVDTDQRFVLTNQTARITLPVDPATKDYQEWAQQVEAYYPDRQTILPPEELPALKALRGETVHNQLNYYKHVQASEGIYLSVNANPIMNDDGQISGAVVVFNNVSDRIKAQQQVSSSYATLNAIIESTHDLVVAIDTDYTVLTMNSTAQKSFLKSTGIHIEKATKLLEVLAGKSQTAQNLKTAWARALQGQTYSYMHELGTGSDNLVYFESVYSPIYNAKGEVMGATMIGRDVTSKRKHENEIKGLLDKLLKLNMQLEEKNKALLTGEEELSAANEELKTQQEELKETVEELASRNFELDQLVYKTSHDIRSPLTSILGLANIMKAENDTSKWPLYLSYIENRVLTLDRFVQSMISYAKANRGELNIQPVNFNSIIAQTRHDLAYMKGYESLNITTAYTGEETAFCGDLFRLQILFNNIISNAIKYQNPYAEKHNLQITIHQSPLQAHIIFTDNGIGIKTDHQARIFDMFYRATENTDGSGLGLYIVKQTVERMKGKISLKSQYGQMTQFEIVIPNALPPAQKQSSAGNQFE